MKLKKILNNNVVIAVDENNMDCILFGLGIAFSTDSDKNIPNEKIEKVFSSRQEKNQIEKLLESIPQNYFDLVCEIVEYIQANLKTDLSNSLYITLMDHISFIEERVSKGFIPKNSLKWEICRYYPDEYQLSKKVVELLEDELQVQLNESEVSAIALHIINAEIGGENVSEGIESVKLVDDILQIITFQANFKADEEDLDYQRLVIHVKFFVQRIWKKKKSESLSDMYSLVSRNYPKAYEISLKVKYFVEKKLNCIITEEEVTYLIMHIQRLIQSNNHR